MSFLSPERGPSLYSEVAARRRSYPAGEPIPPGLCLWAHRGLTLRGGGARTWVDKKVQPDPSPRGELFCVRPFGWIPRSEAPPPVLRRRPPRPLRRPPILLRGRVCHFRMGCQPWIFYSQVFELTQRNFSPITVQDFRETDVARG